MTPDEIGIPADDPSARVLREGGSRHISEVLGAPASLSGGGAWARPTLDVPASDWVRTLTAARDELGCDFFDWLGAVEQPASAEGVATFQVVAHVWSTAGRFGVLVRTDVPRAAPAEEPERLPPSRQTRALGSYAAVPTLVGVYPGAAWHEREAYEMFGVDFPGHPNLAPLLLSPEFEGHPLRKDFVLASRVVKPWPGALEPGESEPGRRAARPPGVPGPGEWGPAVDDPGARVMREGGSRPGAPS